MEKLKACLRWSGRDKKWGTFKKVLLIEVMLHLDT